MVLVDKEPSFGLNYRGAKKKFVVGGSGSDNLALKDPSWVSSENLLQTGRAAYHTILLCLPHSTDWPRMENEGYEAVTSTDIQKWHEVS